MSLSVTITKLGRSDEFGRPLALGTYTANNAQYAHDLVSQGYATYIASTTAQEVNYPYVPILSSSEEPVDNDGRPDGTIYIVTQ